MLAIKAGCLCKLLERSRADATFTVFLALLPCNGNMWSHGGLPENACDRWRVSTAAFGGRVSGDCLLLPAAPLRLQVVCIGFAAGAGPQKLDPTPHEEVAAFERDFWKRSKDLVLATVHH